MRTGVKNTPVPRDAVRAMFTPIETMEADVVKLMEREDRAVETRHTLQTGCPTLHVAVVPGAHYDRSSAPFETTRGAVLNIPALSRHLPQRHLQGMPRRSRGEGRNFGEGRSTSRLFIGDDWLIHSIVAHPFRVTEGEGRLTLHEFAEALTRHMRDVAVVLDDAEVKGPFCILMAVRGLRASDSIEMAFPNAGSIAMPRGIFVERIDDPLVSQRFNALVRRASVYG